MIDGTYKTITTTDGVESPYITSTTFVMTYSTKTAESDPQSEYFLTGYVSYSDNTTYSKTLVKTILASVTNIAGKLQKQFSYTNFDGSPYVEIFEGQSKTVFPYITSQTANSQTWSNGRTYTI
jgi:hypothetical protein